MLPTCRHFYFAHRFIHIKFLVRLAQHAAKLFLHRN